MPLIEDITRAQWRGLWLENLLYDIRHALRQLRRAPAFTATALLTLAFGIGANLGVFQLLYAVILADLPVPHPEELVRIHAARSPFDQGWEVSYPAYQRLRAATPDVPLMATAYIVDDVKLELPNRASIKASAPVSDNYFSVCLALLSGSPAGYLSNRMLNRGDRASSHMTLRATHLARSGGRWANTCA